MSLTNPLSDGVLYSHWTDVLELDWPWVNFTPVELASKREGEFYLHKRSFDALQFVRTALGRPLYINSGHRSWLHNLMVGGAPRSGHLFFAADISLVGLMDVLAFLYQTLKRAGFKGFGFYETFLHVDMGRGRFWFSSDAAKELWAPAMRASTVDVSL